MSCCPPGCGMEQGLAERGREEVDGLESDDLPKGCACAGPTCEAGPLEMVPGPPVASVTGVPDFRPGEKAKHGGFCR